MAAIISVFLLLLSILLKTTSGASCPEDKNASFCLVSEANDKQVVTVELKANGTKSIDMVQCRRLECAILNALNNKTSRKYAMTTEAETTTPGQTTLLLKLTKVQPKPTTTEHEATTLQRTTTVFHRTTTELTTTATTREATTTVPELTTVTTELATTTPEPTTTTPKPTTTMREPTTTMREPTTTMREPTTTMREPTTTMREPTTTMREPTTTMREPTTTMREPTTTMREPTTTMREPTTAMREPTTAMREPTTTLPEPTTTTPEQTTTLATTTTTQGVGEVDPSFRRKRDAPVTCGDDIEYTEDDIDLVDLEDSFFKDGILRIPIYLHRNDCIIEDDLLWDAVHYLNETNELQEAVGAEVHNIYRGLPEADKISGGLPEVNTISTGRPEEADMKPVAVMYFSRYFWIPLALTLLFVLILIIASTVYCIAFRKKNSYAVQKNHYPVKGRVNPVTDVEMLKDEGPVNGHANGHLPRIISDEDGHLVPMSEFNNDTPYEPHAAKDTSTF